MPLKMAVALADALVQLRWGADARAVSKRDLSSSAGKPRFLPLVPLCGEA